MLDYLGLHESEVSSPEVPGHVMVELGIALDMGLIEYDVLLRQLRLLNALPVEGVVNDHALAYHVLIVILGILFVIPFLMAAQRLAVRINQKLGGIEQQSSRRIAGAGDTVAIELPSLHPFDVSIPVRSFLAFKRKTADFLFVFVKKT